MAVAFFTAGASAKAEDCDIRCLGSGGKKSIGNCRFFFLRLILTEQIINGTAGDQIYAGGAQFDEFGKGIFRGNGGKIMR